MFESSNLSCPTKIMEEWICLGCHKVSSCSTEIKCCGTVTKFIVEDHSRHLVSSSNAWQQVWKRWKDHPKLKLVIMELGRQGCFSASSSLNQWIENMLLETGQKQTTN